MHGNRDLAREIDTRLAEVEADLKEKAKRSGRAQTCEFRRGRDCLKNGDCEGYQHGRCECPAPTADQIPPIGHLEQPK